MKNNNGYNVCPICNDNKELIQSHIIPEGFFRHIYDEKGRVFYGSKMRNKVNYIQNGKKERLLCNECDGSLGYYDKYAKEVIIDKKYINESRINDITIWKGLDYNKFKLFHLSILLRAHLSKKVSSKLRLNKIQEEEIQKYIIKGKAPVKYKYPIFAYKLIQNDGTYENCDGIITYGNTYYFEREIQKEIKVCSFIFGGYLWNYIISDIEPKVWECDDLNKLFFSEEGNLIMLNRNVVEVVRSLGHDESLERVLIYHQKKTRIKNRY